MATAGFKAAIVARKAPNRRRGKRTRPEPRQYTVADLQRAQDRVQAAERRIANDHTSNPTRARAGLARAQLELHDIESQLRVRGLLEWKLTRDSRNIVLHGRLYRGGQGDRASELLRRVVASEPRPHGPHESQSGTAKTVVLWREI